MKNFFYKEYGTGARQVLGFKNQETTEWEFDILMVRFTSVSLVV